MCGILAVFDDCNEIQNKFIESSKFLEKRGPDKKNITKFNNDLFVFCRLAINDTSDLGMQPFIKNNKIAICNGEIYNYKELIEEYELKIESNSDCEIIIPLYEKIGFKEMIKKIYGVFAIILVDGDEIYIARDRFGIRPLYYGRTKNDKLVFSSVPNVLLPYCNSVNHFDPGFSAIYNRKTIPHLLKIDRHLLELPCDRYNYSSEKIRNTLIDAVKKRLVSDRPIGCLLSGGLDSSIITAILCKLIGPENVRTYSIGMEGSTDLYYSKIVANYLGTKHKEIIFTPEQGFDIIPEVIKNLATYDITTIRASVGMFLISKFISENTDDKVIFTGEGSDELLQGYLYFHKASSPEFGEQESLRLMKNLHQYDVLRADRCISNNGLEPRVPFLDKNFTDLCLSLETKNKCPKINPEKKEFFEKYILRIAFEDFLPSEIIWRRKEGFSDGVSSMQKPWYSYIAEKIQNIIPDYLFSSKFPSKEAMYYKMIFDHFFPSYNLKIDYWMPKWSNNINDPSGRLIQI